MEFLCKSLPQRHEQTPPGLEGFTGECYQILRKYDINCTYTLSENRGGQNISQPFYEASRNLTPKPDRNITRKGNFQPNMLQEHRFLKNPRQSLSK